MDVMDAMDAMDAINAIIAINAINAISAMDAIAALLPPVYVMLRAFYLGASTLILVIQAIPALRARFLAYGSRATSSDEDEPPIAPKQPSTYLDQLLDYLASFQVPHNYFTHFYILSVACSLYWAWQQWNLALKSAPSSMAWVLMLIQGGRRLAESYSYTSKSKSRMWIGHYILGLVFYLTINVAVWIEYDPRFCSHARQCTDSSRTMGLFEPKLNLVFPAILLFHGLQHMYHAYLYRLRSDNTTYQMPGHPTFPNLLCPHYTCEVMIYLLLSYLGAPASMRWNKTLLCATVFVAVNLGVTAAGTREWYVSRFGAEKMKRAKMMVPFVW
ncbi:3-oxo-5-alpha-steroid 4-dehydrogenase-like protein [Pleomassaria siparia CBS 279.74]|uniref:Polyprenal reductase n=1 Tax=Pleomassaria siparia CBS 279.74 TaxID=1314801 RepID=A0A6G1KJ68_9PLEO|nr:3-oxo-5-alpha-steroid 4-dehydrogenase-like protein [Pleomassaria siparia CBS 279.74]